ncbi:MAG TPA: hypothetical protein EYH44_05170 [Thermoprotei archaeon]|nr:hypothetical protein [Thermoprotei archaeon]
MKTSTLYFASGLAALLAAVQVYLGLNLHSFGVGGLHTHITLAILLLLLMHIPFLRGEGYTKKVYMGLIGLIGLQGGIGIYLAFIEFIRVLNVIHHIFGWVILFGSILGVALVFMRK